MYSSYWGAMNDGFQFKASAATDTSRRSQRHTSGTVLPKADLDPMRGGGGGGVVQTPRTHPAYGPGVCVLCVPIPIGYF